MFLKDDLDVGKTNDVIFKRTIPFLYIQINWARVEYYISMS